MQTTNLKKPLDCAGPKSRLVYIKFTPNGSSAPTVSESHGVSATVTRSSAGVYVVSLGVNAVKAMTVVGCNVLSSGTTNGKLQWAESVANKTVTVTHTLNPTTTFLSMTVPDISTASSTAYATAPCAGKVSQLYSSLGAVISGANAVVTANIAGTPITTGVLTIGYSGSAVGDVDSCTPTAANTVAAGDKLTLVSDGGSTGAAALYATLQIDSVGVASDAAGEISLAVLCREQS